MNRVKVTILRVRVLISIGIRRIESKFFFRIRNVTFEKDVACFLVSADDEIRLIDTIRLAAHVLAKDSLNDD